MMTHHDVSWILGKGRVLGPAPFLVAGIVNVTPDSFYDGGQALSTAAAMTKGLILLQQGADMLDIGGESTRPFAAPVSEAEEIGRVLPVVREILALAPDAVLSVDTTKSAVAQACLEAGALIVNDVSAWSLDPALLDVICQYKPGYVLMHSQGGPEDMQTRPHYENVVDEVRSFFADRLNVLSRAGVREDSIVLDPGIGFGKTLAHNLELLKNIDQLYEFGLPVYMGLSNKSLWKDLLGRDTQDRLTPTLAATVALYGRGVRIHRVHAVHEIRDALRVAQEMSSEAGSAQWT